nr:hypothetical protein [Nocardia gipuzkoensis]
MKRGQLRIYLGAAPGVGKTYAMLGEAHRRLERGAAPRGGGRARPGSRQRPPK